MRRLVLGCLAASACVLIGSCAGDASPPPSPVAVRGFVLADAPVVGAVMTITDSAGVTVPGVSESRTSSAGSFELVTGALPANFTITATGGTYRGQPLAGTMRAAVVQFTPREIYYLTPISSLVNAYAQARHVAVAPAQDSVRQYLKIPAGYKLDPFLRVTEKTFAASGFMTDAASHGGFDAFVASLVPEIGGSATRTFKARPLLGDDDFSLVSWVGTNLVAGAISAGGGMAFTSLLAAGGVPTTSSQLAEVQANLSTMSTQSATCRRA